MFNNPAGGIQQRSFGGLKKLSSNVGNAQPVGINKQSSFVAKNSLAMSKGSLEVGEEKMSSASSFDEDERSPAPIQAKKTIVPARGRRQQESEDEEYGDELYDDFGANAELEQVGKKY